MSLTLINVYIGNSSFKSSCKSRYLSVVKNCAYHRYLLEHYIRSIWLVGWSGWYGSVCIDVYSSCQSSRVESRRFEIILQEFEYFGEARKMTLGQPWQSRRTRMCLCASCPGSGLCTPVGDMTDQVAIDWDELKRYTQRERKDV